MNFVQTYQYEEEARGLLDAAAWSYLESGSGNEQTLRASVAAFEHFWLLPRVLVPMNKPDMSTKVQGILLSLPIIAAPVGFQTWFHPEGELASVKGTGQAHTLYVTSSS